MAASVQVTNLQMQNVLSTLMSLKHAEFFLEPVDWKAYNLPDYPKIVKHPMDLMTMETKLRELKYESFEDFKHDLYLIVDNCQAYNDNKSEVFKASVQLKKAINKELNKFGVEIEAAPTPSRKETAPMVTPATTTTTTTTTPAAPVSAVPRTASKSVVSDEDRDRFIRLAFSLSAQELGKVMEQVDELCPAAIEGAPGADEVDLNVDLIDNATFKKLEVFLKELSKTKEQARKKARMSMEAESKPEVQASGVSTAAPETT